MVHCTMHADALYTEEFVTIMETCMDMHLWLNYFNLHISLYDHIHGNYINKL